MRPIYHPDAGNLVAKVDAPVGDHVKRPATYQPKRNGPYRNVIDDDSFAVSGDPGGRFPVSGAATMPATMNSANAADRQRAKMPTPCGGEVRDATRFTAASAARQRRLTSRSGQTSAFTAITHVRAVSGFAMRAAGRLLTMASSTAPVHTFGDYAEMPNLDKAIRGPDESNSCR